MIRNATIESIMCRNSFDFEGDYPAVDFKLIVKRLVRYIYYRLPSFFKQLLDPLARKFEKRFDK